MSVLVAGDGLLAVGKCEGGRDEASMPLTVILWEAEVYVSRRNSSISAVTGARRGSTSISISSFFSFSACCGRESLAAPSREMTVAGGAALGCGFDCGSGKYMSSFSRAACARFCCRYVRSA